MIKKEKLIKFVRKHEKSCRGAEYLLSLSYGSGIGINFYVNYSCLKTGACN